MQYFNRDSQKKGGEDLDSDSSYSGKLVDAHYLTTKLDFSKKLPKQWKKQIIANEVDLDIAMRITEEFGIIGLLLYSNLNNLSFFNIEKIMLQMNDPDSTQDPLDFVKPIMIYYLNSIKQYEVESQEKTSLGIQAEAKE